MPKNDKRTSVESVSVLTDWDSVPLSFGTDLMAQILRCDTNYVIRHAAELGAVKLAGKWIFFKPNVSKLFGLEA